MAQSQAGNLAFKRTQQLPRKQLQNVLAVARGDAPADLILSGVRLLDLVSGGLSTTRIAIAGNTIAGVGPDYDDARSTVDVDGLVATPGFIDSHVHVESSLMHPFEFERLTLPLGTTAAICDPHEITNVMGDEGYAWFLRCAEQMHQHLFVQTSSCVPALPGFESNGAEFDLAHMREYREHPNVLGLAEMMNFPGVIHGNDDVLDKIEAFAHLNLDGHCPMLRGKELNAYIAAGIQNCHETVTPDEGMEKLQKGMALLLREGSVAKSLGTLGHLVTEFNSPQCMLCTDDRNPFEIFEEGHINYMIKRLINDHDVPAHVAYRLASFSSARHFGLRRLGLIAPGRRADIVLLSDLDSVAIEDVLIGGKRVEDLGLKDAIEPRLRDSRPPSGNTIRREPLTADDFDLPTAAGVYNVIEIVRGEIITRHRQIEYRDGDFAEADVVPMVNIERYGHQLPPAVGLVRGSGLNRGAIAASVAHDSHNLMVIGISEAEIAHAANTLIAQGGGFCAVDQGQVLANLPLPVAGLISLESGDTIAAEIKRLKHACRALGITLDEPFLQLAFLALPVIPALKLTDRGLVDVTRFEFIDLKVN